MSSFIIDEDENDLIIDTGSSSDESAIENRPITVLKNVDNVQKPMRRRSTITTKEDQELMSNAA
jgi:hypothetical protein